jgi:carbon storage regulator
MLVLTRKIGQCIVIDSRITVKVIQSNMGCVRIGIAAPPDVEINRQEVQEWIDSNHRGETTSPPPLKKLVPPLVGQESSEKIVDLQPAIEVKKVKRVRIFRTLCSRNGRNPDGSRIAMLTSRPQ